LVVGAVGAVAALAGFEGPDPLPAVFPGADPLPEVVGLPVAGARLAAEPALECPLPLGAGALSATGFAAGLITRAVPGPHLAAPFLAGTGGIDPLAAAGPAAVGPVAAVAAAGEPAAGEPEAAGLEALKVAGFLVAAGVVAGAVLVVAAIL
jgi:hypothetical protein